MAGGRIIASILLPRVLVLCEMQSASSRFWTRVAVFNFNDDNHYTIGTSMNVCMYKDGFALDNPQGLICNQTQTN